MILFYVTSISVNIASVRYRAMLPALYLLRDGVAAEVHSGMVSDELLKRAHCVVLVKAFGQEAMSTAIRARQLGIPVILDLCDDIFVDNYGATTGKDQSQYYFRAMAALAAAIVTPTECLAQVVRSVISFAGAVHVIPDLAERFDDVRMLRSLYGSVPKRTAKFSAKRAFAKSVRIIQKRVKHATHEAYSRAAAPAGAERIVLWFGSHGTAHSDSGMTQILWLAPALLSLSRKHNIKLVVVSDNPGKFRRYIKPLPIKSEYVEWTPTAVYHELKRASVAVVPFGIDRFSQSKSANRVVLALSRNVPVVCTDHPSLGRLREAVFLDEWEEGIDRYLSDPALAKAHLRRAAVVLEQDLHGDRIAKSWCHTVLSVQSESPATAKRSLLCFLRSIADANVLLPICRQVGEAIEVRFVVFADLAQSAPSVLSDIRQMDGRVFFLHPRELVRLDRKDVRLVADVALMGRSSVGENEASMLSKALEASRTPILAVETHLGASQAFEVERYLAVVRRA